MRNKQEYDIKKELINERELKEGLNSAYLRGTWGSTNACDNAEDLAGNGTVFVWRQQNTHIV